MLLLYSISALSWVLLVSSGSAPPPAPTAPLAVQAPPPNAVAPYMGPGPVMGGGGCVGPGCGPDFNPVLLGGRRGYPGIRARLNSRMFQYASQLVGELLNKEIQRARLPDIIQSTQPMIEGCIVLYNAYVSRYRCPSRVVVFPKAPNCIVLQVQNLDVGVTGNLGGEIKVIFPIPITGIAQINIHGVSLTVEAAIVPGPHGPTVNIVSCCATVDYVDVCIENGGLVGSIANSFFRRQISDMVRDMLPDQLCKMLPKVVNEQINSKASAIPQAIALTQLAMLAGSGLSASAPKPDPVFCEQQCGVKMSALAAMGGASPAAAPQIPESAYGGAGNGTRFVAARSIPFHHSVSPVESDARHQPVVIRSPVVQPGQQASFRVVQPQLTPLRREKRATEVILPRTAGVLPVRRVERRLAPPAKVIRTRGVGGAPQPQPSKGVVAPSPQMHPLCSQCSVSADDPAGFIRDLAQNLNLAKLNDMFLSVQLLNTYATDNDFTADLTGEFSPGGQGGTPFGPFPTMFPKPYDNHMLEAIVTDYTINSLLYWMHKKGFLSFRIGPETPKIGELLKTTCSEDDEELEDHGVQTDEEETRKRKLKRRHLRHLLTHRSKRAVKYEKRIRRQETTTAAGAAGAAAGADSGSLSDLGICFGDILPAVREKYPNKKISIQIHSIRAPSIILSSMKGGSAVLNLCVDADIYIDGTNTKVGTITITADVNVALQMRGNRLYGMGEISNLKLTDSSGSLGLPQDALDNLGTLGKELLTKLANDALAKGIPINLSQSPGLPVTFYNPQIMIIEHGLYVAGDITVSPALLGTLGSGGSGGTCYRY